MASLSYSKSSYLSILSLLGIGSVILSNSKYTIHFLAHMSTECSVSYCGHSTSAGVRPSVHNLLVNTLASTNINQSSPNLIKMYMTTRARMSSIMEPIGPELSELSALEFENLQYLTVYSLASTNINQSSLNLVKMYMTTRARMSSIMEPIRPELSELSALAFENLPYLTMFTR